MTTPATGHPEIGDLVRDSAKGTIGVLTDVHGGVPVLRPRWGGGLTGQWPAEWGALLVVSRRGTWEAPF
jgi:hypothetical protein